MNGPWIKAYAALEVHRKTARMAALLDCIPVCVIGGVIAVWWMADREATPEGFLSGVSREDIDAKVRVPGFASAMESVGWLEVLDDGVQFPEFDKHMGQKHRSRVRERVKKRRQRARESCPPSVPRGQHGDTRGTHGDCPPSVPEMSPQTKTQTLKGVAQNPVDSSQPDARGGALDSPTPEPVKKASSKAKRKAPADWRALIADPEFAALASDPAFVKAFGEFIEYRESVTGNKPWLAQTYQSQFKLALREGPARYLDALDEAISTGWKGHQLGKPFSRTCLAPQGGSGVLSGLSRQPTGQEVVASLRRKMAAQAAAGDEGPRETTFEPLFKVLPMPVKKEA